MVSFWDDSDLIYDPNFSSQKYLAFREIDDSFLEPFFTDGLSGVSQDISA